jgi:hypothetical protein
MRKSTKAILMVFCAMVLSASGCTRQQWGAAATGVAAGALTPHQLQQSRCFLEV